MLRFNYNQSFIFFLSVSVWHKQKYIAKLFLKLELEMDSLIRYILDRLRTNHHDCTVKSYKVWTKMMPHQ